MDDVWIEGLCHRLWPISIRVFKWTSWVIYGSENTAKSGGNRDAKGVMYT